MHAKEFGLDVKRNGAPTWFLSRDCVFCFRELRASQWGG